MSAFNGRERVAIVTIPEIPIAGLLGAGLGTIAVALATLDSRFHTETMTGQSFRLEPTPAQNAARTALCLLL